ncbi:ABC transporter substrate-binding protein [Geothrix sp. PMB-07]|uniref:ABC transporter substrate-binding protein n=1 Tax=Geothrix sp. PMB-07 TaxID=3068640 RepID=UPI0027421A05|nr:ABC transporter substrate-binding protein [Geothrix sp. PMB-07]WLT30451.1 ABC transporter substrate-binding protein [Geothrix sp. PMB-07]
MRHPIPALWRFLSGVLAFALTVTLQSATPRKVTLQLKWAHQFQFAGYYAAQAKGFYRAEGLEATLVEGGPFKTPHEVVERGEAQFGVGDMQTFNAYQRGHDLVALGVILQHSPHILVAPRSARISRPSDLIGRRVMFGAQDQVELIAMLQSEGLRPEAVHAVRDAWSLDDLVSGKVDALAAYSTVEPFLLREQGVPFIELHPSDYGVDFYGDILFTTATLGAKDPKLVQAFQRASFKGWEYALEHPEEIIDLILKLPNVSSHGITREQLRFEAEQMRALVLPGLVEIGHMNPGRFQRIAEINLKQGRIQAIRDPSGFIFTPPPPLGMPWLKWIGFGLAVALVGSVIAGVWIIQLRHQVEARTRELQREVAHRRQAEADLAEREQRFRLLVENLPAGAVYIDDSGFYPNAAIELMTGYDRGRLSDLEAWLGILEPRDAKRLEEAWAVKRGVHPSSLLRATVIRCDGQRRSVEISMRTLPTCEVWMVLDVTAREEAEAARQASEDRYRGIYQNSSDLIKVLRVAPDGQFRFEGVNPSFTASFGISTEQVAGKTPQECFSREVAEFMTGNLQRCLAAGRNLHYEEVLDTPLGKRMLLTQLVPIRDPDGRIYLMAGISRDLTDERKSQEALRQAQKLESLGVLAGGIAHDFNNLLSAVLGNLNLAQAKLPPHSASEPYLQSMESTILRAADLTRQMLAYSGKGRFVVERLDLSHLVEEITHLLSVSISKKVALRYDLPKHLPGIEADASQIQQVIMNLVTNASEAIGDREGVISIATGTRDLDQSAMDTLFAGQDLAPGRFVTLQVSDTGCGMNPETLAKIFDPFFTTKASGRGLGLSAMLGILRGHDGGIKIYSEPGKGSTFQVYLRALGMPGPTPEPAVLPMSVPFEGKVLLVDDEPDLRGSIQSMLEHLGFEVEAAKDGLEALERFSPGAYALVLMDLTMPRMDGKEAFRRMKELDPTVKVVLSSGYNEQEAIQQFLGRGLAGFIQKPYQMKTLVEALERALRTGI